MKLSKLVFTTLLISIALFSCKPIYKCGEAKPTKKLFLPKFIQVVITERDSLCTTLSSREKEIITSKTDVETQKSANSKLEKKYADLANESLNQAELFNLSLKQKSDELKLRSDELIAKEKLLAERESSLNVLQK